MSSDEEVPLSEPAFKSGAEGATGAALSISTAKAIDADEVFPAASVALAVTLWLPALKADEVMLQLPAPSAAAVPKAVVPSVSYSVTVLPASAVPVKVGVELEVMSSDEEVPLSEPEVMLGAEGALGAWLSTSTEEVLPTLLRV
jgi:hypothetical protein